MTSFQRSRTKVLAGRALLLASDRAWIPIVEPRRRVIFLRQVSSTGAKTGENAAALLAEVTPGVVALAAAAVAITGPFSDAGRAPNLRAQRGQEMAASRIR